MSADATRTLTLVPHPAHPPGFELSATADVHVVGTALTVVFRLAGDVDAVRWPHPGRARRADVLWEHTVFEAFAARPGADGYVEGNLSPSGEWAAYRFTSPHASRTEEPVDTPPTIAVESAAERCTVTASFGRIAPAEAPVDVAATMVLEGVDGTLSYWAAIHPRSVPDFHARTGFRRIEAPDVCGAR